MRFRFLGTGTSSGVPAIACECAVCTSSDARDRRLRTGAALEFTDPTGQHRVVLLDATPDFRQQALAAGLRRCDAIFFTHNHVDHVFGLDEVRRFNAVQKTPIDIFADTHTMQSLRRVYQHIFDRDRNINDSFVASLITHEIDAERPVSLHGLRIVPIRLLHGKLPILGYRIERDEAQPPPAAKPGSALNGAAADNPFPLAYCTDVSAIPPESWRQLRGVKTLVLDALRHRKHPTHFTLEEAVHAAEHIGASQTWFVHMSHDLLHAEIDASLPPGMNLAYDGLVLG